MQRQDKERKDELELQKSDYFAMVLRGIVGAAPYAGALLAELVGVIIPNQRMDRLVDFVRLLDERLSLVEKDIRSLLLDEEFADLLEEGLHQVARGITEERRRYIANLIANSISEEEISFLEAKYLMKKLEEINDIEVIWLRYFLVPTIGGDEEFRSKHSHILEPIIPTIRSSQQEIDKAALQKSYKEHLVQLGLLQYRYQTSRIEGTNVELPELEPFSGAPRISGYEITSLGKLLLRMIGIADMG